ncbi:MAG: hypothetical protein ACKV19_09995 [Verrucomicrobiales bacterium]
MFALGLAAVATATALLLADAGVFEPLAGWLFAGFESESLSLKELAATSWPWLPVAVAALVAFVVVLVAVDATGWTSKLVVLATGLGAVGFLSLTLAFYGLAYDPWPALAAAGLAFAMGCLLAETPSSRQRRAARTLIGDRASPETLDAWSGRAVPAPWHAPTQREGAVLAVRLLSPAPAPEAVGPHLVQRSRSLGEVVRLLRARPGVVLDVPAGDSVRAFFGIRPESTGGDLEAAAHAALELATVLREEATLQAQVGKPSAVWGIGLSVGPLVIGLHGPEPHPFWTASGAPAEQARQLAALNARHHTSILVGRRAADALAARFELRAVEGDAIHALIAAKAPIAPEEFPLVSEPDLLGESASSPLKNT